MGFDNRDCYNHLKNLRHRQLDGGDVQLVLTYFRKKQVENPQTFNVIQCDEKGEQLIFFGLILDCGWHITILGM